MIVWVFSLLATLICGYTWWCSVEALAKHRHALTHIGGLNALWSPDIKHKSLLHALLIAQFVCLTFFLLLAGDLHNAEEMSKHMDTQYLYWKIFDCVIGVGIYSFLKYIDCLLQEERI